MVDKVIQALKPLTTDCTMYLKIECKHHVNLLVNIEKKEQMKNFYTGLYILYNIYKVVEILTANMVSLVLFLKCYIYFIEI